MTAISVAGLRAYAQTLRPQLMDLVDRVTADLLSRIPFEANENLKVHLRAVLWDVIANGGEHIEHYNSPQDYGFESQELFFAAMQQLKIAWRDDIDMNIEGNCIEYVERRHVRSERTQSVLFVQFVRGDKISSGIFDGDLFMFTLAAAASNGKDPIAALGILADEACRANVHQSPAVKNATGE